MADTKNNNNAQDIHAQDIHAPKGTTPKKREATSIDLPASAVREIPVETVKAEATMSETAVPKAESVAKHNKESASKHDAPKAAEVTKEQKPQRASPLAPLALGGLSGAVFGWLASALVSTHAPPPTTVSNTALEPRLSAIESTLAKSASAPAGATSTAPPLNASELAAAKKALEALEARFTKLEATKADPAKAGSSAAAPAIAPTSAAITPLVAPMLTDLETKLDARIDKIEKAANEKAAIDKAASEKPQEKPAPVDLAPLTTRLGSLEEGLNKLAPNFQALEKQVSSKFAAQTDALQSAMGKKTYDREAARLAALSLLSKRFASNTPYVSELKALENLNLEAEKLQPLKVFAEKGVPSQANLSQEFERLAAPLQKAVEKKPTTPEPSLTDKLWTSAFSIVQIRQKGEAPANATSPLAAIAKSITSAPARATLALIAALPEAERNIFAPITSTLTNKDRAEASLNMLENEALAALAAPQTTPNKAEGTR